MHVIYTNAQIHVCAPLNAYTCLLLCAFSLTDFFTKIVGMAEKSSVLVMMVTHALCCARTCTHTCTSCFYRCIYEGVSHGFPALGAHPHVHHNASIWPRLPYLRWRHGQGTVNVSCTALLLYQPNLMPCKLGRPLNRPIHIS